MRKTGNRALAFLLGLVLLLQMLPTKMLTIYAVKEELGTASALTEGIALEGEEKIAASVTDITLDWAAAEPEKEAGWWVGVKMTAPASLNTQEKLENAFLREEGSEKISFWERKNSADEDTEHYVSLWVSLDEEKLGNDISYTWEFDWDGDNDYEQSLTLTIDPAKVTLMKDEVQVFPAPAADPVLPSQSMFGTVEGLTEGLTVSGEDNSLVVENTSPLEISWVEKDETLGRNYDGWWVGFKVTAPVELDEEIALLAASFKRKNKEPIYSFGEARDSRPADAEQFVGFWCYLTVEKLNEALKAGEKINYSWEFDWNADGIFEQEVRLSVDPNQVVLKKDEDQVYPALGEVSAPYTGGVVGGTQAHRVVTAENITLSWSPADAAIGRSIDAWWFGIKVIAPSYDTKNAVFQMKSGDGAWSEELSFWASKDSADNAEEQYIQIWIPLTPERLSQAVEAEKIINHCFRFDWNHDGIYEQDFTILADPKTVELQKTEQKELTFETSSPKDQWVGEPFTNTVSGGSGEGSIHYSIKEGNTASVNPETGEVTFERVGTVTILAVKDGDDTYNAREAEYTVTAVRKGQTGFKFETTSPGTISYVENGTFTNSVVGGSGTGAVTYSIESGEDIADIDKDGKLTLKKAGTVTIKAVKAQDDWYLEAEAAYSLIVAKAAQSGISFDSLPEGNEVVFGENNEGILSVAGGSGNGKVVWSVTEGTDVASVDESGKFIALKAGTVKVEARKEGDDCYAQSSTISVTITVKKAKQEGFAFAVAGPVEIAYNENGNRYTNVAAGGASKGAITYSIAPADPETAGQGTAIASVEGAEVSILRAGSVIITATHAGDECYEPVSVSYTLTIMKAQQSFQFKDGAEVLEKYGLLSYENAVEPVKDANAADGKGYGTGAYSYTLSGDAIGATIDENTGSISFAASEAKVGTVTVTAMKAADDCYQAAEASYTLTLSYLEPASAPTLSGAKLNESGWYTGDVTISAPEGYTISYQNSINAEWSETLQYSEEGEKDVTVYLRAADGAISDAILLENIFIDKTNPEALAIAYAPPGEPQDGYLYYNDSVTVTLSAKNSISGIEKFTYSYGGNEYQASANVGENGICTCEFTIPPQFRGTVTMTAVSASGRTASLESDVTLIVDNQKPTLEATFNDEKPSNVLYSREDVTARFEVTEANFDRTAGPKVTVNGIEQTLSWTKDETTGTWKTELPLTGEGEYQIAAAYTDASGNAMAPYAQRVVIDRTAPSGLTISYAEPIIQKVLEKLTFGFYKAPITVTVSATDSLAGISSFTWRYTRQEGADESNLAFAEGSVPNAKESIVYGENGQASICFSIEKDARGSISATVVDNAGNTASTEDSNNNLIKDEIPPKINVTYKPDANAHYVDDNGMDVESLAEAKQVYYQSNFTATIEITEANFFEGQQVEEDGVVHEVSILVTRTDNDGTVTLTEYLPAGAAQKYEDANPAELQWKTGSGSTHTAELTLVQEGDYVLQVAYKDFSENAAENYTSPVLTVDKTPPVVAVTYGFESSMNLERAYLKANTDVKIEVTEHNFRASDFEAAVTALNSAEEDITLLRNYRDYCKNSDNWTHNGDVYTIELSFDEDANYTFDCSFKDLAFLDANDVEETMFTVDKVAPAQLTISYAEPIKLIQTVLKKLTFGFYNPDVVITLSAEDAVSGVSQFSWSYEREADADAVNVESESGTLTNLVRNGTAFSARFKLPAEEAKQYRGSISFKATDRSGNEAEYSDANSRITVVDTIAPERSISYSAARVMDGTTLTDVSTYEEGDHDHVWLLYRDEAVATLRVKEANFYPEDITLQVNAQPKNPDHEKWTYSEEEKCWVNTLTLNGNGNYTISMEYPDRSGNEMSAYKSPLIKLDSTSPTISVSGLGGDKYSQNTRTATVTISESNFRQSDVRVSVSATDADGNTVPSASAVSSLSNWSSSGDSHSASISFGGDGQYTLAVSYTDLMGNSARSYSSDVFVVDKTSPTDLQVTYSEAVRVWEKVLNAVTLGYYTYQPAVKVTISATDTTSGIDHFTWRYTREADASAEANIASREETITGEAFAVKQGSRASASFTLTGSDAEQFCGHISFTAYDAAGNSTTFEDEKHIAIVDTISPTRQVVLSPANRVVAAATMRDVSDFNFSSEEQQVILYYHDEMTATFTVHEANFYAEDVEVTDNGTALSGLSWTRDGDTWTATVPLAEEGDHLLQMLYTDRAGNEMTVYRSQRIVIDKTQPAIAVSYKNTAPKNTLRDAFDHERQYYDAPQTAVIAIRDKNFRPDEVAVMVSAQDIMGANVEGFQFTADGVVESYQAQGANREEWSKLTPFSRMTQWRREDDTYTLELHFDRDANYSLSVTYTDLAGNPAETWPADYFTVDQTAPGNTSISYSANLLQTVLQAVTFGYYNASATVTISAEDETSGINRFLYSYVRGDGVSAVNAELLDKAIGEAEITRNGAVSTVTFSVPGGAMNERNQFDGNIRFTAIDRAENSSEQADRQRIVVDTIRPTATIRYSEPEQHLENTLYYGEEIRCAVQVDEANFFAEDVQIAVTRDGAAYPVSVSWMSESADRHIGSFALAEDGEYYVSVQYTDRSNNRMDTYTSERLILDTRQPEISVSSLQMNSATNAEIVAFSIAATDQNNDPAGFEARLMALVQEEDGTFVTQQIPLGEKQTVEEGHIFRYEIENLPDDAVYTLTCTARDRAGNETHTMKLDDGSSYDEVRFSVNRSGSVFSASPYTLEISEQYYIFGTTEDLIIEELNVDPVENYAILLNAEELVEGRDYTTMVTRDANSWSVRTYRISAALFEEEGEYRVVVRSVDKASTSSYSDVKNLRVSFAVDRTAPAVVLSGLEQGGRYQVGEQKVQLIPTDDGGRLSRLEVTVLNADGEPLKDDTGADISVRFSLSGEELTDYLETNGGMASFTIPEGLENQVRIVCSDSAARADGSTNTFEELYTHVTVSQSSLIMFYANKPLFYGSIGGVMAVIGAVCWLVSKLKRRKMEA